MPVPRKSQRSELLSLKAREMAAQIEALEKDIERLRVSTSSCRHSSSGISVQTPFGGREHLGASKPTLHQTSPVVSRPNVPTVPRVSQSSPVVSRPIVPPVPNVTQSSPIVRSAHCETGFAYYAKPGGISGDATCRRPTPVLRRAARVLL